MKNIRFFCVSIFSPYNYSHLGNARLDAIPTSMSSYLYLLIYVVVQRNGKNSTKVSFTRFTNKTNNNIINYYYYN